jgi:hypothetical protein
MKTKLILTTVAALVLAGCEEKKPEHSSGPKEVTEFTLQKLDWAADDYLRAIQRASLKDGMEDSAKQSLVAQRTAGAAALKQMEYADAKREAEEANSEVYAARKALETAEDELRKSGYEWKEATYSAAISGYEAEAQGKLRAHLLARSPEDRSRLHKEWLDFLSVKLDQIKSGEY